MNERIDHADNKESDQMAPENSVLSDRAAEVLKHLANVASAAIVAVRVSDLSGRDRTKLLEMADRCCDQAKDVAEQMQHDKVGVVLAMRLESAVEYLREAVPRFRPLIDKATRQLDYDDDLRPERLWGAT